MRSRTEIKEHLLTEFSNAPLPTESPKAGINRQLVILNAQLAVLIEVALDFRDLMATDPEFRDQLT